MSSTRGAIALKQEVPDQTLIAQEPSLVLSVVEVDGNPLEENPFTATIPFQRLQERIIIGCESPTQIPLFHPDLDLQEILKTYSTADTGWIVSRQHVLLGLQDGVVIATNLSHSSGTSWIERSTRLRPLLSRYPHVLRPGDILILGNPSGRCVRIRIEFSSTSHNE